MYIRTIITLILITVCFLQAEGWERIYPGTDANINGVFLLTRDMGFAAGDNGLIITTTDGAKSWQIVTSPTSDDLKHVYFIDGQEGWICGTNGAMLHTEDGGDTWQTQQTNVSEDLTSVYFSGNDFGWACGTKGTVLRTVNGGTDWEAISSGTASDLYDINFNSLPPNPAKITLDGSIDELRACAVDLEGFTFLSATIGSQDILYSIRPDGHIKAHDVLASPNGLEIGPDNRLYGAVSYGRTKRIVKYDDSLSETVLTNITGLLILADLAFDDAGNIWIVGYNTDWKSTIGILDDSLNVKYFDVTGGYNSVAVHAGYLYTSGKIEQKESVWRYPIIGQDSLGSAELYFDLASAFSGAVPTITDIDVSSSGQLVISFPAAGGVLRVNGPSDFYFDLAGNIPAAVSALAFSPDDRLHAAYLGISAGIYREVIKNNQASTGWICGIQGTALKSTDTGKNWSKLTTGTSVGLFRLYALDSLDIFASGAAGTIIASNNGGADWEISPTNTDQDLRSICGYGPNRLWCAGGESSILISENSADSWYEQNSGDNETILDISFFDQVFGVAAGENGIIYRTESAGYPKFYNLSGIQRWMNAGSLHNWFSAMGTEIEAGRTSSANQQDGWQWPAIGQYQDMQCSKGMWIGTTDYTDFTGYYPYKVVHVGPRVSGFGEFFPTEFRSVARYERPDVMVNGSISIDKSIIIDSVRNDLFCDQMIVNTVNTMIGLTMTRRIIQFSLNPHDNYIIQELEFKNTGNVDRDPAIEYPDKTLTDVYFFFLYRWAMCFQTRHVIGNATGWGINSMLNARGDGTSNMELYDDPPEERFRAQYAWHGYYPEKIVVYDNIGGPIWSRDGYSANYLAENDTIGRLGAGQFTGVATIHADISPTDRNDDSNQPATTGYYGSDEPLTSNNDAYNKGKMESEYQWWITRGNMTPRHAWKTVPSGDFSVQKASPNFAPGGPGGFTAGNGYGPYTLAPGESIRLVLVEASSGIDRETAIETGRQYKNEKISDQQKNEIVLTGEDSLFQTFRYAIANYESGYNLPAPPPPPSTFAVNAGDSSVALNWAAGDPEKISGVRIYRSAQLRENKPELVAEVSKEIISYVDRDIEEGVPYYYFIQSVGPNIEAIPDLGIPSGPLLSGRYYTQTYDPVIIGDVDLISKSDRIIIRYQLYQNYPNPFNPETTIKFEIPHGTPVELMIYNLLGQKVKTVLNTWLPAGAHETRIGLSDFASGTYVYVLRTPDFQQSKKMLLLK